MRKYIIGISIFILLKSFTIAQQTEWKIYNTINSDLPDNQIQSIYIDQDNVKWLGTASGLVRFDGDKWDVYDTSNTTIPSSYITDVETDGKGGIWIGTGAGLVHYTEDEWNVYNTENSVLKSNGIINISFSETEGNFFSTDLGFVKYKNGEFNLYDGNTSGLGIDFIQTVAVDLNGDYWVGTFDNDNFRGILWNYDGINWTNTKLSDHGLFSSFPEALKVDLNNILWLGTKGTNGGAVVKIENGKWNVYDKLNSGFTGGGVGAITIEGSNKWIATGDGLILFDGNNWTEFKTNNSELPDDFVSDVAIDKNGNKWITTISGGLAVFNEGGITSVEKDNPNILNEFVLYNNYPNPFNPTTTISFTVPNVVEAFNESTTNVVLKVYDILGNEIEILVNEHKPPGNYKINFDGSSLSSGVYYYQFFCCSKIITKKMVLLK
ncbi:MAG: T9SS type A sorting domain-containing protein [Bacteroidetes bacterium]|nr:T9SS type A sorting domain-containing protein [Bacteroidota bacterium]